MDLKEQFHLKKLTEGDVESFIYLHKLYQSKVYHYCFRFVRNQEITEEITSDVFVKLWEKRIALRTDIPIGALLFKIAKDLCISCLREISKNADRRQAYIDQYLENTGNPIEEEVFLKEGLKIAGQAIDSLPPKCQEVFRLRYVDGMSLGQIAEHLQISTNTVQNHLLKGSRIVKHYLQKHADLVFSAILIQLF